MNYEIMGIKRKTGVFQGKPYDKTYLHCKCLDQGQVDVGQALAIVSIKTALLPLQGVRVGAKFTAVYNPYGKICEIILK